MIVDTAHAQPRGHHLFYRADAIPGAIGNWQLARGITLPGYFQPVEIQAPQGAEISLAVSGHFDEPAVAPVLRGLQVAQVYRFRVTNIPLRPGLEVFPTVELIDRIYPPHGAEQNFPIPIHLTAEDLDLAAAGRYVTRVIYVENPDAAVPIATKPDQPQSLDVTAQEDPLQTADRLGRPVAILRLGARVPSQSPEADCAFFFGSPQFIRYEIPRYQGDGISIGPSGARLVSHPGDLSRKLERLASQPEVSP